MEKIQARVILEILGRPKEHIVDSLNMLVERLGKEKGMLITEKKIHEPLEVKDSKDLYTTFAEVTLELDSLEQYIGIVFAYMPANIEIIYPDKLTLPSTELNFLANKLTARLHEYDAIAKNMLYERDILVNKLREVAPQLFKQQPAAGPEQKPAENTKNKAKKPKKQAKKSKK